jgi:hypothetical protein
MCRCTSTTGSAVLYSALHVYSFFAGNKSYSASVKHSAALIPLGGPFLVRISVLLLSARGAL